MPESAHQSDSPLSQEERKQLLVLACEMDRAAWNDSCRPRPRTRAALAAELLRFAAPALAMIPGLPKRWLQRLGFVTRIARQVALFKA